MPVIDIAFPKKGWHTMLARYAQPEDTSPDLLNLLPFDGVNRLRGATRPGTSKLGTASAMGSGQPVQAMAQAAIAIDPTTIRASTQLTTNAFAYTNGTLVSMIAGGTDWRVSRGNSDPTYFPLSLVDTTSASSCEVTGNYVVSTGSTGSENYACIYQPSLSLGAAFVLSAQVKVLAHAGSYNTAPGLLCRVNKSTYVGAGVAAYIDVDGVVLVDTTLALNSTGAFSPSLTNGSVHTLQLNCNGNIFQVYVDGILKVQGTSSANSSQSGVGFAIGRSYTTAGGGGLTSWTVNAGAPLAQYRQNFLIAIAGGSLYIGDNTGLTLATNGSGIMSPGTRPQTAISQGYAWIVDSLNYRKVNLTTQTAITYAATASDYITTGSETIGSLARNVCAAMWRDRLVLAGDTQFPQTLKASRQGVQTDWDYGQLDAAAAFALAPAVANKGTGGIGEPINCLMPFNDDVLFIGCDHTLYKVEGDPAAGGQILIVSDQIGTLGPDCWDIDPTGAIWFVGTGGLYKMSAGMSVPESVSGDKARNYFNSINRASQYVACAWDRDRNGLWIFVTSTSAGQTPTSTHLFYDNTTSGLFPTQFPDTQGPITGLMYEGDAQSDRQILLAGRDGYIRKLDQTVANDDGSTINAYLFMGPFRPSADERMDSLLTNTEVIMAEQPATSPNTMNMVIDVFTGKDAFAALPATPLGTGSKFTGTISAWQRRKRFIQRVRGGVFFVRVSNTTINTVFTMEKLSLNFEPGGLQRRY